MVRAVGWVINWTFPLEFQVLHPACEHESKGIRFEIMLHNRGNFVLAVCDLSHVTYITCVNYEMEQSCFKFDLLLNLAKKFWCWNRTEPRQFDNVITVRQS